MELNQKITRSEFQFDLQGTPAIENIHVIKIVTAETYDAEGNVTDTWTRYQITNNFPFYLSVDCASDQLHNIIDTVQYVIDNTP